MTPQQHADHLLSLYQERRDVPPEMRLPPRRMTALEFIFETLAELVVIAAFLAAVAVWAGVATGAI